VVIVVSLRWITNVSEQNLKRYVEQDMERGKEGIISQKELLQVVQPQFLRK
jgi:hypothetical protein